MAWFQNGEVVRDEPNRGPNLGKTHDASHPVLRTQRRLYEEALAQEPRNLQTLLGWAQLEEAEQAGKYVAPLEIAMVQFALGHKTKGFARMREAVNDHSFNLGLYAVDPVFDLVREEPEFAALMNEIHLPRACWHEVPRYRK